MFAGAGRLRGATSQQLTSGLFLERFPTPFAAVSRTLDIDRSSQDTVRVF